MKAEEKLTAIEWMMREFQEVGYISSATYQWAIEMEEKQIVNAWDNSTHSGDYRTGKEYYDETFKSE